MIKFPVREEGQGLVEYALILVLVAIVVIAILLLLGPIIGNVFSNITAELLNPTGSGGGGSSTKAITGVTARDIVGKLQVTVTVSKATTVSLSGGGLSGSQSCSGSCVFSFSSYSSHGTVTATASDGSTGSATW